jgi:AcrR family transcriptional regulator
MRALAQRCGVSTMTLYRHVHTKEDLLAALADRVLRQLALPEPGVLTWQEELAIMFRSVHDLLIQHPDIVEIAAKQPVAGEAAYRGAEVVLDALRRAGIEGEPAASAFATLFSFTLGFVQQQLFSAAPGDSLDRRRAVLDRLPLDDFDNLGRLGAVFLLRHSDRHFDDGLDTIIRGLERKAATERRTTDPAGSPSLGSAGATSSKVPGGSLMAEGQSGGLRQPRTKGKAWQQRRAQGQRRGSAGSNPAG